MRTIFRIFFFLLIICAFRVADVDLSQYGVNVPEFKTQLLDRAAQTTFQSFTVYLPDKVRAFGKKLTGADKVTLAKTVSLFVKGYISSAEFKASYLKSLDGQKESENLNDPVWKEALNNEYQDQLAGIGSMQQMGLINDDFFVQQQQIYESFSKTLESAPAGPEGDEMRIALKRGATDAKNILALRPLLKTDKTAFAKQLAMVRAQSVIDDKLVSVRSRNKDIDQKKDYRSNIKTQLRQFLDETADVDYDAKTSQVNGRAEFVNPDYRQKSLLWKQAYRLGKPGMTVFRQVAEDWSKEL